MPIEVKILSAGAVKPGLTRVIDAFHRETTHEAKVRFATAPAILNAINGGETIDIVIAPPNVLDQLVETAKVPAGTRVMLGRIGIGVMVREGATLPHIATVDEFKEALLSAESLVYNQASTGTYLETLFDRLGMSAQLAARTTRYADFAAVLDHVSNGKGREVGLGATTVIIENAGKGVKFAGALPEEIQNYTAYESAVLTACKSIEAATEFMHFLTLPEAKRQLIAAGIG
jgi:molybdate transport system substrate-binding protein